MMSLYIVFLAAHFSLYYDWAGFTHSVFVDGVLPDSFRYRNIKAAYVACEDRIIMLKPSISHTKLFAD